MSDTYSALALEAADLRSKIDELEESYIEVMIKISKRISKNLSNFEYPDAPDGIYATAIDIEHERYGTPITKRSDWLSHALWAKNASSFCKVDDEPYCHIEGNQLLLGGTTWCYGDERDYVSVELPLRWLDVDREDILADLARMKAEADAEEKEAAAVIEAVKARDEADARAKAEAAEYETYIRLKAKYEG